MTAIHPRFRGAMLERLFPRLENVRGETAVLGAEPKDAAELGLDGALATHVVSLDERRWDSLVCVAELWRMPNLELVVQALKPQGRLFFVDPVAGFGLAQRAQGIGRSLICGRYGLSFETDVPQALRDAGITPTSTDRFRVGNLVFTFAAGEARVY
jgi:hypothetical protein